MPKKKFKSSVFVWLGLLKISPRSWLRIQILKQAKRLLERYLFHCTTWAPLSPQLAVPSWWYAWKAILLASQPWCATSQSGYRDTMVSMVGGRYKFTEASPYCRWLNSKGLIAWEVFVLVKWLWLTTKAKWNLKRPLRRYRNPRWK